MTIAPPITLTPLADHPPPVQDPPGIESPLLLVLSAATPMSSVSLFSPRS